jgi:hypothetical protein
MTVNCEGISGQITSSQTLKREQSRYLSVRSFLDYHHISQDTDGESHVDTERYGQGLSRVAQQYGTHTPSKNKQDLLETVIDANRDKETRGTAGFDADYACSERQVGIANDQINTPMPPLCVFCEISAILIAIIRPVFG